MGPQIAQRLGIPVVTYVMKIRELKEGSVIVERQLEDGYEVIEINTPCMLTAVKELNNPRYMSISGIEDAYKKTIAVWNEHDVALRPESCGLKASPTQVFRSFTPAPKGKGEMLSGSVTEMAAQLVQKLTEKHAL